MIAQAPTKTLTPEAQSLLNHLHMGGDWAYFHRFTDHKSIWYPAGEFPPLPGDKDIYFGVHPTRQRGTEYERSTREGDREVSVINALYAEFDGKDYLLTDQSIDNSEHLNAGKAKAIEKIIKIQPQPSVIIDSGGGFHCYWLLAQAWNLNSPEDRTAAAELEARWVEYTGADKGAKDLARVLRVPGTLNGKYDPARRVEFHTAQFDLIYDLSELQAALVAAAARETQGSKAPTQTQPSPAPSQPQPTMGEAGEYWLTKALGNGKIGTGDETGFWLACQLRDAKLSEGEITRYCKVYAEKVEQNSSDPFTDKDAERWVNSALKGTTRDPAKRQGGVAYSGNGHHPQPENAYVNSYSQKQPEALQPTEPTPGAYRLDDIGNGERLARRHGWRLRYVKEWDWLIYTGSTWENDRGQSAQLAKETARSIYAEAAACEDDNTSAALAAHAKATASENKRRAMLAAAASEPGIMAAPKDFDVNPWLLNCENGVLDLRTGNLANHNPELLLTKKAGAAYDPGATCPTWVHFLDRIFAGNQDLIEFLQRAAGYTLTGNISEQKLFFLYGTGANGKSTFTEALQAALGDYARKTPTETLMQKYQDGGGGPNPDIARLAGARMVSAAELADGRKLNEPLIKDMTGGDKITARYLNKEFFEFSPAFKLWMYGNHQPKITGTDNGIWRRVLLVPFTVSIPEREQDKKLSERLRAELPGILAWAVAGCLDWQAGGLRIPQEVINATAEYKQNQDTLALFFAERCTINSMANVKARDLYNAYKLWAAETNTDPGSEVKFSQRMTEKGYQKTANTGSGRTYSGIGLVQDDE